MSDSFLISDSLKGKLTKENFFNDAANDTDKTLVSELFINKTDKKVYMELHDHKRKIKQSVKLSSFEYNDQSYKFNNSLEFNIIKYYHNHVKKISLCTIVIDEELFWSNLQYEKP